MKLRRVRGSAGPDPIALRRHCRSVAWPITAHSIGVFSLPWQHFLVALFCSCRVSFEEPGAGDAHVAGAL